MADRDALHRELADMRDGLRPASLGDVVRVLADLTLPEDYTRPEDADNPNRPGPPLARRDVDGPNEPVGARSPAAGSTSAADRGPLAGGEVTHGPDTTAPDPRVTDPRPGDPPPAPFDRAAATRTDNPSGGERP